MGTKITSHAGIEEIVEAFLNSHPRLWVKPENGPGVDLVEFIVKSLDDQHRHLCTQHIHENGRSACSYCGYDSDGIMVGSMSGHYDFGVTI